MTGQGSDQQGAARPALRRLGPPRPAARAATPPPAAARPSPPQPPPPPEPVAPPKPEREIYSPPLIGWYPEEDEEAAAWEEQPAEVEASAPSYAPRPEPSYDQQLARAGDTDDLDPRALGWAGAPQPATAARGGEGDRNALMFGAGCVLMMVAGIVIAALLGMHAIQGRQAARQPDRLATVPAAIAAVATPQPTDVPTPTPSPTPIPSIKPTPLPTWTPMPGSGDANTIIDYRGKDAQYKTDMTRVGDFVQSSITTVNDLLKNPQLQDDHWQYQIGTQIEPWKEFYATVSAVEPPTRYQTANDNLTKALQRLNSAADDLAYGVENNDQTAIKSAQDKIAQGSQLLSTAMSGLKSTA